MSLFDRCTKCGNIHDLSLPCERARIAPHTVKSDVPKGINKPKSPERSALEKKLKESYGSPEQVRLVLELKEAYESRGIKFYHPWIQGPDYLEIWKRDTGRK